MSTTSRTHFATLSGFASAVTASQHNVGTHRVREGKDECKVLRKRKQHIFICSDFLEKVSTVIFYHVTNMNKYFSVFLKPSLQMENTLRICALLTFTFFLCAKHSKYAFCVRTIFLAFHYKRSTNYSF